VKVIKNIRDGIRHWFLKKALKKLKRQRGTFGYKQANSFLVYYDASTEKNYDQITGLVKEFQNDKKKVKTLGFYDSRHLPEYCYQQLNFEFCSKSSFAWDQKPVVQNINDLLLGKYDVLIDLTPSDYFHMKYLTALSDASFKVGRYHEKYVDLYDFMIQIPDETQQEEAINHTIFYLKMLNNDSSDN